MDKNQDFSALRNLLALKKLETPQETHVDRFLIEFHRRQRAHLLTPATPWGRLTAWVEERMAGISFMPSLSYAAAFAVIGAMTFLGLSQQVQVTHAPDGQYQLSLHMPTTDSSLAMLPVSSSRNMAAKPADKLNFTPTSVHSTTTRFVLASSNSAYDANVGF